MRLDVGKDSRIELMRNVYGKDHRIVLYHSSSLENRQRSKFMKRIEKVTERARKIMYSGNSDSIERAGYTWNLRI